MKRHLLTAALAIVALGGAVASTARSIPEAGPFDNFNDTNCQTEVLDCVAGTGNPCLVEQIEFFGHNEDLGTCNIPLTRP